MALPLSFNVSTYNVLHPYVQNNFSFLPSGGKDWSSRAQTIADNILNSTSDLLCLQEVSQAHFQDLKGRINHVYEGFHTKHDGRAGMEKEDGVAVFYRKDRFHFKAVQTCNNRQRNTTSRRDLYIDVEEPFSHRIIRCAVAHIEGNPNNVNPGDQQLQEIMDSISFAHPKQDYTLDAVLLGCDLNQTQDNGRFKILKDANFEANVFAGEESEVSRNRQIDWIFFKAFHQGIKLEEGKSGVHYELPLASDHRMVSAQIDILDHAAKNLSTDMKVEEIDSSFPSAPLSPFSTKNSSSSILSPIKIPTIQNLQSKWDKFTEKMADIFSRKNALWLVPLSCLSLGLIPLAITIFNFFYYVVLKH